MSNWNYRIMRSKFTERGNDIDYYGIYEVYYNNNGQIVAWSAKSMCPEQESAEELIEMLEMMLRADEENTLEYDMESEGDWDG